MYFLKKLTLIPDKFRKDTSFFTFNNFTKRADKSIFEYNFYLPNFSVYYLVFAENLKILKINN